MKGQYREEGIIRIFKEPDAVMVIATCEMDAVAKESIHLTPGIFFADSSDSKVF
jgi:hypothetical protein